MTRDEWIKAFAEALAKLRPHLADQYGFPVAHAARIAAMEYAHRRDADPAAAARDWHKANPAKG